MENPVFTKETRSRMRGTRAYGILFGYLLLITGILSVIVTFWTLSSPRPPESSEIGQVLFFVMAGLQIFLVCFISPACTSGSITLEREQRTLEMLVSTLIKARAIAIAKLGSALSFLMLLMITSAPLTSLCFLFGGIAPSQVALIYLLCITCAVFFAVTGLFWSAVARRTTTSTVMAYSITGFFTVALFILYVIGESLHGGPRHIQTMSAVFRQVGCLSPFIGMMSLIQGSGLTTTPIASPLVSEFAFYWLLSVLLFLITIRRISRLRA